MSYFKNMIPKKGINNYHLKINPHGEMILTSLNHDLSAREFVCGNFKEVFVNAFNVQNKDIILCEHTRGPRTLGCESWEKVCEELNSKKDSVAFALEDMFEDLIHEFLHEDDDGHYSVL